MNKLYPKLGWRIAKFGEIAENIAIRVKPSEAQSDVYVGLEHLDPDSLHLKKWGHPSDVEGDKLRFWKGDIIFGRRRAYQRKLAVAEFDGICSAHAMVLRARPQSILPDFLPFFLQSDMFMNRAINISVGSLSPTINWSKLREEEFSLPPIEEQKHIAEILWAADGAAVAIESSLNNYIKLATTVRNHFAEHLNCDRVTLGQLALKGELDIQTGPFGTILDSSSYVAEGTPILNPVHMDQDGYLSNDIGPFIGSKDVDRLNRYRLETGDILLSRKGEMGKLALIREDRKGCLVGSDCMRLRFKSKRVLPQFVYEYLRGSKQQSWFRRFSFGTTMPGLNEPTLHLMPLHIPAIEEQMRQIAFLKELHIKKKQLQHHLLLQRHLLKRLIEMFVEITYLKNENIIELLGNAAGDCALQR